MKGAFGRVVKLQEARIVGWLPKEESDFKSEQTGEPAALWHILWDDGQEEDLEEWEVVQVCKIVKRGESRMPAVVKGRVGDFDETKL